jgi:hypothetical protein
MVFSAVNFNLEHPVGPMKGAFVHLGFPDYFRIELTVAKTLGVLALVMPGIPSKAREFAYAGNAGERWDPIRGGRAHAVSRP